MVLILIERTLLAGFHVSVIYMSAYVCMYVCMYVCVHTSFNLYTVSKEWLLIISNCHFGPFHGMYLNFPISPSL